VAPKHVVFWGTLAAVVGLDQLTKRWVAGSLAPYRDEVVVVPHLLSIIHAENPGAAFGLMQDDPNRYVFFAIFTGVVSLVLLAWYRRVDASDRLLAAAVAMILGGTLGNAIDRAEKRTVTDFVRFHVDQPPLAGWLEQTFGTSEWPAFNVADSALLIGLLMFLAHAVSHDGEDALTEQDGARGTG
jgi:signal peptidase II